MGVVIGLVVVVLLLVVPGAALYLRSHYAGVPEIPEDRPPECASCGSGDVRVLAEGAYDCLACGYEGGEKREAYESARRRALYATWPFEKRMAAARAELDEARRQAIALGGDMNDYDRPYWLLQWEEDGSYEGDSREQGVRCTALALARAERLLVEATEKFPGLETMEPGAGVAGAVIDEAKKLSRQLDLIESVHREKLKAEG